MTPTAPENNARPEDLQDEPDGFWDDVREDVDRWLEEYGEGDGSLD